MPVGERLPQQRVLSSSQASSIPGRRLGRSENCPRLPSPAKASSSSSSPMTLPVFGLTKCVRAQATCSTPSLRGSNVPRREVYFAERASLHFGPRWHGRVSFTPRAAWGMGDRMACDGTYKHRSDVFGPSGRAVHRNYTVSRQLETARTYTLEITP